MPKALGLCPSFVAEFDHSAPNSLRRLINKDDVTGLIHYRDANRQRLKD